MHSSISAHIAKEYLLDEARDVWGPNMPLFRDRLGNEGATHAPLAWAQTSVSSLLWRALRRLHCPLLYVRVLLIGYNMNRVFNTLSLRQGRLLVSALGCCRASCHFMLPVHNLPRVLRPNLTETPRLCSGEGEGGEPVLCVPVCVEGGAEGSAAAGGDCL